MMINRTVIAGLTGGIATGKSTCTKILMDMEPSMVLFDADACVHELYQKKSIKELIKEEFGNRVFDQDGYVDRTILRNIVFDQSSAREALNAMIHPFVRKECLAKLEKTVKEGASRLFVADIPLLFESEFQFGQSVNLLVLTRGETQVKRLTQRNAWSDEMAKTAIAMQMPVFDKMNLADVVLWNEGPVKVLENQCRRLLQSLHLNN